ncbi:patatin-like phospholipase family protein [Rivibacter subsaxonicus]|uniref:NTE family protein n=1 Tax=Rivibacter subsaxonicus TaxID=457575 RepID=A0A4Q7W162_9BURK|nr:patatin-like phospholipase family protein [Rivibacter subsaxonicus]RZU02992.1 NTE family protein [Rivibacter subsaxonicus]
MTTSRKTAAATRGAAAKKVVARPAAKSGAGKARRRIAIACQGGGSQTAFTAGALCGLLEGGVNEDFEIVSISGTSGGAICAALVWYALHKGESPAWQRVYEFWRDNMATTPQEKALNRQIVGALRLSNAGAVPSLSTSPYSPWMQMLMHWSTHGLRPDFSDFRGLLEKHLDFDELRRWGALDARPVLLVGAVDVLSGKLARFSSRNEAVRVEQLLASAAVPDIFQAVEFDGGAYWDGLFSDNPPISEALQGQFVGEENIAQEIWVIKINPTTCAEVPQTASQISSRRNELIGNGSLFQQIEAIQLKNELYLAGAFNPAFARRLDIDGPVKIPKCFASDPDREYHIPFIEMSETLSSRLDYESKLDRDEAHIEAMIADGEQQAEVFLAARRAAMKRPR